MAGKAGVSGRPPKPVEQKRMLGITRTDRVPDPRSTIKIAPAGDAPAPSSLQEAGKTLWERVLEARWIAKLDLRLVETFCELADDIVIIRTEINKDGFILEEPIVTPTGKLVGMRKVANPLLKELRTAQKHQLELAINLGFSPTGRSRLGVAEIKAVSKLADIKARLDARAVRPDAKPEDDILDADVVTVVDAAAS